MGMKRDLKLIGRVVVDRIHLAQDKYWWKALVNTVVNRRVPGKARNFRKTEHVSASQDGYAYF